MIGQGKEIKEVSVKRFIGIGNVSVIAVNPDKKTLEEFYGNTVDAEPVYIGTTNIGTTENPNNVESVRVEFLVKEESVNLKTKVVFFLANSPFFNRDGSKIQVINAYGETAWVPVDNAKAGTVPENMGWFNPYKMRPAYRGEENLIKFIKAYVGIPNPYKFNTDGVRVPIEHPEEAECLLDHVNDYFKGDFKELQGVIKLQPMNKVKCLFGVTNRDGNIYQTVFTRFFMKSNNSNTAKLELELSEYLSHNSNAEFEICPIKEYTVEATNFEEPKLDNTQNANPWFNK